MNKILIAILLFGIAFCSCSTTHSNSEEVNNYNTTIYLVRHAEKADDGTSDPSLTMQGKKRAQQLAELLHDKNISQIYSSDYKRTRETAFPISRNTKIAIRSYDPRSLSVIANQLSEIEGQNVLVVGHSNSTPSLANLLLEKETYTQFDESDYSNLIVVTITKDQKTTDLLKFNVE